jgi:hypothetical protein
MIPARLASGALAALFLLAGCGSSTEIVPLPPRAEALDRGLLVTTGDLDRPYDEIALLRVGPEGDEETDELLASLRIAARRAGADAVVRVDFDPYGGGEDGSLRWVATGTAVRFR